MNFTVGIVNVYQAISDNVTSVFKVPRRGIWDHQKAEGEARYAPLAEVIHWRKISTILSITSLTLPGLR